jgi:hypothetical protein
MDVPPFDPPSGDPPKNGHDSGDGVVEGVAGQTELNYSFLSGGATEELILHDRLPVARWSTIGVSIRTHAVTAASGTRFLLVLQGIAPSPEDGADFVTGDLASNSFAGSAPNLEQLSVPLTDLQVPMLRVILRVQGPSSAGTVYIRLSVDVVLKSD